jgi:hypothetical protein
MHVHPGTLAAPNRYHSNRSFVRGYSIISLDPGGYCALRSL